ncbi:ABC transporter ATP-binding protein [Mucilaginibacter ginsenosidivorans]|uniref:ABC transporter ATP-binding protein n=1 Tax=Mucilaginibacter ginsenosidivorans TaxID=398053 RepID=A0A5B8USK2_9SPHI|nr:ABC transporter ATP-binding protein [Mucilaginibacter ginsenosidivorans]QEC61902.1 ABC transporter ATP-binding protein [Mucilaginibacter ginsenosidivorans]
MIKVERLSKHFNGVKAVDDISFEVKEHENLVLLGTSGCGKTTTLKMLNRLIEPTSGSITINNQNILDQKPEELRRGIGYVLQNNGLFPHYTVAENIAIVPQLLKWDSKRIEIRIAELIEKLHLSKDQLKLYPNELSGGQQQRVGLARALVADPPVLLMDEPFGALDNITRSKIQIEFKELDELKRKTIIMVTHDVQEAFELGDRICLMDKGKIVQIGTPAELLFNPANQFVADFLRDQRLQLEFKSVTVKDIWELLPSAKKEAAGQDLPIDSNIWAALQKLSADRSSNLYITYRHETKSIGFEQLTTTFYKYQSKRPHE